MKKRIGRITFVSIFALVLIGLAVYQTYLTAEPLDTYHSSWHLVRDTATEDGATFDAVYNLDANEGNWASKGSDAWQIVSKKVDTRQGEGQSPGAVWAFVISGGLADNDTFSFNIVGWSKTNGFLQVIAEGDGVIGTQDVVLYPHDNSSAIVWWADTINLDETDKWPGVSVRNSGDNEVCMILVDTAGLEWLQFVIYDADGSGTEANNLTVFGRRY